MEQSEHGPGEGRPIGGSLSDRLREARAQQAPPQAEPERRQGRPLEALGVSGWTDGDVARSVVRLTLE